MPTETTQLQVLTMMENKMSLTPVNKVSFIYSSSDILDSLESASYHLPFSRLKRLLSEGRAYALHIVGQSLICQYTTL